jgi:hypothetical protein
MTTLRETKEKIIADPEFWKIYFFDFVDDFREYRNPRMIEEPFQLSDKKIDALLASTVEYLCDELIIEPPEWLDQVPPCREPYYVQGIQRLKNIAALETPLRFQLRKIFVLHDFLSRI